MNNKAMNKLRREHKREIQEFIKTLPAELTLVSKWEYPQIDPCPIRVWRSRKYLVQLYEETAPGYPGLLRMSVNRTTVNPDGSWQDGITWDELQTIKREIGYGDRCAVEVYPADQNVINVANIRHLWIFEQAPSFVWEAKD